MKPVDACCSESLCTPTGRTRNALRLRIEIRDATLDDAPALAALSAQLGYATEPDLLRQRRMPASAQRAGLVGQMRWPSRRFTSPASYITLYLAAGLNITALVVDASHQQSGIGRRLLDHAADYARHHQLAFLRVNSGAHREQAQLLPPCRFPTRKRSETFYVLAGGHR